MKPDIFLHQILIYLTEDKRTKGLRNGKEGFFSISVPYLKNSKFELLLLLLINIIKYYNNLMRKKVQYWNFLHEMD